jgi:hypothetical protein
LYDKACEHISCALRSGSRGLRRSLHEYPPSHAVEVALGVQLSRQRCASRVWRHLETPRLFRSRNCWPPKQRTFKQTPPYVASPLESL